MGAGMAGATDRSDQPWGGDDAGFHCHAVASPTGKSGFVIMTNGDGGGPLIRDLLLGDLMNRFL
jgi:hypothetical protein